MLLSHIKRLCTILPSLIAASPQNTDSSSPIPLSLPAPLQDAVPACAQPCLRASLLNRFPVKCTVPVKLDCLCGEYSSGGESLGEIALGCIYASCSTVDSQAVSAYNICLGQSGAVSQTQTVLKVTAGSSIRSQLMSSSTPASTTKPTSTLSSSSQSTSSTVNSVIANSISTTDLSTPSQSSRSASASTSTSATAVAATTPSSPTMKPAQIAGLSVAAAATFIVAIGLMVLSVYLRRRGERRDMAEIREEKPKASWPRGSSSTGNFLPGTPPKQFPLLPLPKAQTNRPYSSSNLIRVNPNTTIYAVPSSNRLPQRDQSDLGSIHPVLRPAAATSRNSSKSSVPLDQIGLAISAEVPGSSAATVGNPRRPHKSERRQSRVKSVRHTLDSLQRPDSSLTQDTVFEEDTLPARRRSSKLLPTPTVPVPPIRSFQPSRPPPPAYNAVSKPRSRPSSRQQVGLSLDIPVRHSRSQPTRITPPEVPSHALKIGPAPVPFLAPPIQITSDSDPCLSRATSTSTSNLGNDGDIPDYYFTSHRDSPEYVAPTTSSLRIDRSYITPKGFNLKPKLSSSNASRATSRNSRASTNIRDSISSQTSFETTDGNDPTPEDEDDDKQLSDDNKLSPVAESPISNLRYPKIPRASNQLVPRSPRNSQSRSPQSQRSQGSPLGWSEPSALLVKRRGETEAFHLESKLQMDSPNRTAFGNHSENRRHMRSNSVETWSAGSPSLASNRQTRILSGQWVKSPAMYDIDVVQPLNVRSKQQQQQAPPLTPSMEALKSPAWVPNLTPTRQGDDLFISVTYSKPAR